MIKQFQNKRASEKYRMVAIFTNQDTVYTQSAVSNWNANETLSIVFLGEKKGVMIYLLSRFFPCVSIFVTSVLLLHFFLMKCKYSDEISDLMDSTGGGLVYESKQLLSTLTPKPLNGSTDFGLTWTIHKSDECPQLYPPSGYFG